MNVLKTMDAPRTLHVSTLLGASSARRMCEPERVLYECYLHGHRQLVHIQLPRRLQRRRNSPLPLLEDRLLRRPILQHLWGPFHMRQHADHLQMRVRYRIHGSRYAGNPCVDVDERSHERPANDCNRNATCTNTDGSYTCECKAGFTGDGGDGCNASGSWNLLPLQLAAAHRC